MVQRHGGTFPVEQRLHDAWGYAGQTRLKGNVSMRIDPKKTRVRKIAESPSAATLPEQLSPGWDQAVSTAAARLNEGWILPETECDPAAAEELAAFLCAYGT
jgi:hypothetical protein